MKALPEFTLEPGLKVWVWDSTWLPAVVVRPGVDSVLVRLEHGVTFEVVVDHLDVRDPACCGSDRPRSPCGLGGSADQKRPGHKPSRLTNYANQLAGTVVELPRMKTGGA